jgi:hypothetical protein
MEAMPILTTTYCIGKVIFCQEKRRVFRREAAAAGSGRDASTEDPGATERTRKWAATETVKPDRNFCAVLEFNYVGASE